MLARGFQRYQAGELAAAELCFRDALSESPDDPEAMRLLGEVLIDRGRAAEAVLLLRRLAALHPDHFVSHYSLANAYRLAGQNAAAIASYREAVALNPQFAGAQHGLGLALRNACRESEALEPFKQAVRARPEWAVAWKDLGVTLAILGDLTLAEAALQRAVTLQPDLGDAQRHLAGLRPDIAGPQDLARLAAACAKPQTPAGERVEMLFALGRLAERSGDFDAAFKHFAQANGLLRAEQAKAGIGFDRARLTRDVDELIGIFSQSYFSSLPGQSDASELPVFILGMPRAGSTLFEQIAASHSQVFGAGERAGIGEISAKLGWTPNPAWTAQNLADAARRYLDGLAQAAGQARRIIDKMPDNIFQLGLIATLFPKARVIFCGRDARDVALSCFFQRFAMPYGFDTDLEDCAFRIREVGRLTAHWHSVLPVAHMTMSYEALLASPEAESRRLIAFLGLQWEPQCLEFHLNRRAIRTASLAQVRRPLYQDSAGRWRHYKKHLAGLDL
jgi:tetratricopeptide (TPR) repeat protein